jgi:predicted XRE-type DNA-binding protein
MNSGKRTRLKSLGWKVGTAQEFLGLSEEEAAYVDLKLQLAHTLREQRQKHKLTQVQAAKLLKSSQSRVAKMEAGDPTVSIDLLVRSLLTLGVTNKGLAKAIQATGSMAT